MSWIIAIGSRCPNLVSRLRAAVHMVPDPMDTCRHGRQAGCPTGLSPSYLETRGLLWDWPEEEEVVVLSWEKPLVQDSRLDMEPLKSSDASTS